LLSITGCQPSQPPEGQAVKRTLEIKGSDTMVNLNQKWAEEFMKENPKVQIAVTGGGSGTGIAAMINGTTDIAATSRKMKPEEIQKARTKGIKIETHVVALDGLAVAVNPNNPINTLTFDQLAAIFTGQIRNWKEVGGPDKKIVLLSRESNSGTHVFFKEKVLQAKNPQAEFSPEAQLMPSSQAIADELKVNEAAIGYFGLGYSRGLKLLKIKKDGDSAGIKPSIKTVQNKTYPIWRPLYWHLKKDAPALARRLLNWVLSKKGQKIVKELDFVPLK
jgi:phosphate transport system substrate-binding protein